MKKFGMLKSIVMLAMMVGCLGCAAGQRIKYNNVGLDIKNQGIYAVAVATLDSRQYVVNGEKEPSYIGTFRGGWGNPFDVTTESNNTLSKDMTNEICASLNEKGYQTTPIYLTKDDTKEHAISKLKGASADRLILLTLHEWYSDTYQNTSLYYDAELNVMSKEGNVMGQSSIKGEDDLGGSFNPPANAKEKVPQAYKKNLETLLNESSVINALK